MFLFFIHLAIIIIFVFLFIWQAIILIAIQNAVKASKMPAPVFWWFAAAGNLLFILIGLMAVLITQFQLIG